MTKVLRFAMPLIPLALICGCADAGDYPSLAQRPVESGGTVPAPSPAEAPTAAADPSVAARIVQLLAQAHDGDTAFAHALEPARATVGRAGATGSESWIAAQQAVSRLEGARTQTVEALSDLDALARERSQKGASADVAALAAATSEVSALADAQQEKISALTGLLPTG